MTIKEIVYSLESWAPAALQEDYDNAGLVTGDLNWLCSGIICTLDATEEVIAEAKAKGCNLVVAHHPIVFRSLKKFSNKSYVERTLVKAIKNDVAIYAIHTNLDNIIGGVSGAMARALGLNEKNRSVLSPKKNLLSKIYTYLPESHVEVVKSALFEAGAGTIGLYAECSFGTIGTGSFMPLTGSDPFIGTAGGQREQVAEVKVELIFPSYRKREVLKALLSAHPYEEVAYEIIRLENTDQYTGAGIIGELASPISENDFLLMVKDVFNLSVIKHTAFLNKPVQKIAVCGGAGSFLLPNAIAARADVYLTADVKYHEFFDADNKILFLDIGHWESEQFTIPLLVNFLKGKFPTFAVLKTEVNTNPVHHFV